MDRRTLRYAAAVLVVFAAIVAGALALGGDDEDEPRDAASATTTSAEGSTAAEPERTETQAEQGDGRDGGATAEEPEPATEPDPAPTPAPAPAAEPASYTPYSASTGDWQASLPSGNGWKQPAESQLPGGRGLRVTVRGPAGAALVIDHTPSAPARFGSKYRSSRELPQASVGSMTEYRLSDSAVGYVIDAGDGGFRMFATGVEGPVARRVADSLTFVDL
jgi:hypothetical protein